MESSDPHRSSPRGLLFRIIRKIAPLIVVTLFFGWFFAWAAPVAFPVRHTFGFAGGMLHGALMPMALPSLLLGKNVEIYAPDNSGRIYKIGYIVGINVCGLFFFGSAFWRPNRHPKR